MNRTKPRTFNSVLVGASVGVGVGLAIAVKDMIGSWVVSGVVAAVVAGSSTLVVYKLGLRIAAKKSAERKPGA